MFLTNEVAHSYSIVPQQAAGNVPSRIRFKHSYYFRSRPTRIIPYPKDEFQSKSFGATLCHIRPALIPVHDCSLQHTPETESAGHVQEYYCVTCLKPGFESA